MNDTDFMSRQLSAGVNGFRMECRVNFTRSAWPLANAVRLATDFLHAVCRRARTSPIGTDYDAWWADDSERRLVKSTPLPRFKVYQSINQSINQFIQFAYA